MKRKKLFSILFFLAFLAFSGSTLVAQGQIQWPTEAETGLPDPAGGAGDIGPVKAIIVNVAMWLLGTFGAIAIISFVVSGIQYFAAGGNENVIETAKRNMTYSIIGVIVALSGFVIIQAVDHALRVQGQF